MMNQPTVGQRDVYYGRQASADDLQRMAQANRQAQMNNAMVSSGMGDMRMMSGQSLDDLVNENQREQQRRNLRQQMGGVASGQNGNLRRLSMMEFGAGQGNSMDTFQFQGSPMVSNAGSLPSGSMMAKRRMVDQRDAMRRQSADELGLNTHFEDMGPSFGNLTQSPIFQQSMDTDRLDLDPSNSFMQDIQMGMDDNNGLDPDVAQDVNNLSMFSQPKYSMPMSSSIPQQAAMSIPAPGQNADGNVQGGAEQTVMEKMPQMNMSDAMMDASYDSPMMMTNPMPSNGLPRGARAADVSTNTSTQNPSTTGLTSNPELISAANSFTTSAALPNQPSHAGLPNYLNAYSQSGFDMLGILMRVAARPKPQISIGAVDMSCAFVVCDVTKHDIPIVYCSEMFERLTGYTRHEILGRNCRFLQAPDGTVQSGLKRKYVDDMSVFQLKKAASQLLEAQISLINYRKGGQPFMNLLTMIPISWDSDDMKYYVGFQVDLVDQPASITNKNPGQEIGHPMPSFADLKNRWNLCYQLPARPTASIRAPHARNQSRQGPGDRAAVGARRCVHGAEHTWLGRVRAIQANMG